MKHTEHEKLSFSEFYIEMKIVICISAKQRNAPRKKFRSHFI